MLTNNGYLKKKIDQIILEQISELSQHVALGSAQDYPSYMRVVGKIEGLRLALDLCEEAEKLVKRET